MKIALALVIASLAGAASAQVVPFDDPAPGYAAILNADYVAAEREIRQANVSKYDVAGTINLGIVFAKTGRPAAAERLFRRVLMLEDTAIVVADRSTLSSHDVAAHALALLGSGALNH